MTDAATRRVLLALFRRHGAFPAVVFDVDELSRFTGDAGAATAASALAAITDLLAKRAARSSGDLHMLGRDRFLVPLPAGGYDHAVAFAEQCVDAVRALGIPFPGRPSVVEARLTVTAVVVSVQSTADVERFELRASDLLRDGKSTGGDVVVRDT